MPSRSSVIKLLRDLAPELSFPYFLQATLLTVAYLAMARLGLGLVTVSTFAALVWPPAGIALAAILLLGKRYWLPIVLGAFLINYSLGAPLEISLSIGIGNALEGLVASYLLGQAGFNTALKRIRDSVALVGLAATLSTMLSASIGITALYLGGLVSVLEIPDAWTAWWVGDALGILVITPLLLVWSRPFSMETFRRWRQWHIFEALGLTGALAAVNLIVFFEPTAQLTEGVAIVYPIAIPLLWAALRFGMRGATLALFATATFAIVSTILGYGPFAIESIYRAFLFLQIYIALISATFLILTGVVEERQATAEALKDYVKRLEQALKAISASDRAKHDFLAILAHELRNPLSPIVSSLELIRSSAKPLDRDVEESVSLIDKNVGSITKLLDDFLDISRINKRKLRVAKEIVDLRTIVERSAKNVETALDAKRHHFSMTLLPTPAWVEGDPLRLEQVLVNILNNAIKYTDTGGRIDLVMSRVGSEIRVLIRDSGIGIEQHVLPRIFEPFLQARSSRGMGGGLGLGLSLARRLIQLHRGRIEVASAGLGRGSEFTVALPLSQNQPLIIPSATPTLEALALSKERAKQDSLTKEPGEHPRVLVVDDNEEAAQGIGKLLTLRGYKTHIAFDGPQALRVTDEFHPDIVLLDIGLPDMDGYEVARTLRATKKSSPILVAVTGYGQPEDKLRAKKAGFDHHLTKPVAINDLENLFSTFWPNARKPLTS